MNIELYFCYKMLSLLKNSIPKHNSLYVGWTALMKGIYKPGIFNTAWHEVTQAYSLVETCPETTTCFNESGPYPFLFSSSTSLMLYTF